MRAYSPKNNIFPLVSVIIPFYNREKFLSESIKSVLAQSETDWELLLIDDGSTDSGGEIVREFAEIHADKIRLLHHEDKKNKGAGASRNLGIAHARGKFITFLDSDDVFFPDALENQLSAFQHDANADAVCGTLICWYSWSDEPYKGEKDFKVDLILETEKLYQPPDLLVHNLHAGGRKPGIDCVMLKSDFAKRINLFEDDYRYIGEDQIFWAKVSLHGNIYVTNNVLAKYRQHPASTCAVESSGGKDADSMLIFLDWLENYLRGNEISDDKIWKALKSFRRTVIFQAKFNPLKQLYRRILPLRARYKIRDKLTKIKERLARSSHRHKKFIN